MRGVLIFLVAIAMLVVGILLIKNLQTDPSESIDSERKTEIIDRAEDAADAAGQKIEEINQRLQQSE
jgi:hypothetical protein